MIKILWFDYAIGVCELCTAEFLLIDYDEGHPETCPDCNDPHDEEDLWYLNVTQLSEDEYGILLARGIEEL